VPQPGASARHNSSAPSMRASLQRARLGSMGTPTNSMTRVFIFALIVIAVGVIAKRELIAQRRAANETQWIPEEYQSLSRTMRELIASQDTWNAQLHQIRVANMSRDKLTRFEADVRRRRPVLFGIVRDRISKVFRTSRDEKAPAFAEERLRQAADIERYLGSDRERVLQLFEALDRGDLALAERRRDELVTRGSEGLRLMHALEQDVTRDVDATIDAARARENRAILVLALTGFVVLVIASSDLWRRWHLRRRVLDLPTRSA